MYCILFSCGIVPLLVPKDLLKVLEFNWTLVIPVGGVGSGKYPIGFEPVPPDRVLNMKLAEGPVPGLSVVPRFEVALRLWVWYMCSA